MVHSLNPQLAQRLQEIYRLKDVSLAGENTSFQPIIILNDKVFYADTVQASANLSGAGTVYTVENNPRKQFYLTSASWAVTGSGNGTVGYIEITSNGITTTITEGGIANAIIDATATTFTSSGQSSVSGVCIPIDKNSNIRWSGTVDDTGCQASVRGFYVAI